MAKATEIRTGGIYYMENQYSGNSNFYSPMPRKKAPKKLRNGEVVHGIVIKVYASNQASVRLPSGTFNAIINGDLRKGDSLLFKVKGISPNLLLHIYAVSVKKNGVNVSRNEILRILNLEETKLNLYIVSFLSKHKNIIKREDVYMMNRYYSDLSDSNLKNKNPESVMKLLMFHHDLRIKINAKLFENMYPLFQSPKEILQQLQHTVGAAVLSEEENKQKAIKLFNSIKAKYTTLNSLMDFFSDGHKIDGISIIELLEELRRQDSVKNNEIFLDSIEMLLKLVQAQNIWGEFANSRQMPIIIYMPIPFENDFAVLRLSIANTVDAKMSNNLLLSSKSPQDKAFTDTIKELNKILSSRNYKIQSIILSHKSDKEIEILQDQNVRQMQQFSIVV